MLIQQSGEVSRKHAVIRPGFWRLSATFSALLLGLLSTVVIARVLGPDTFGRYAFALWLATAAAPAIGVGLSAWSHRALAELQSHETPRVMAGIFYILLRKQNHSILLYSAVYLLLIFPFTWFFGSNVPALLLILAGISVPVLMLNAIASITLRGLRRFDLLACIHLFGASTTLLLAVLSMQSTIRGLSQAYVLALASITASVLMLFVAFLCIVRLLPLRQAQEPGMALQERLKAGARSGITLFALDMLVWQRVELLLLGHGHAAADLAYYTLASVISTRLMQLIPTVLTTCVLPITLRLLPSLHSNSAKYTWYRTTLATSLLALLVCAPVIYYSPAIITFFFGPAYLPVVLPLRILLVAAALGSSATVSMTRLADGEHRRAQFGIGLFAATLNIALAIPFITFWGVTGAALAGAGAQSISALGSILIYRSFIQARGKR